MFALQMATDAAMAAWQLSIDSLPRYTLTYFYLQTGDSHIPFEP